MPSINENVTAVSFVSPQKRPAAVVEPERDTPGNRATHCIAPIATASATFILSPVLLPFMHLSDINRRIAVKIKAKPSKIMSLSPSKPVKKSLKK